MFRYLWTTSHRHILFFFVLVSSPLYADFTPFTCCHRLCSKCKHPTIGARYTQLRTKEEEDISDDPQTAQMKRRIKFHLMNPFQKWSYAPKRRFPWKMLLQVVNMILVVVQVCTRGSCDVHMGCYSLLPALCMFGVNLSTSILHMYVPT